jgi:phage baseplate assembly protein W
MSSKKLQFKHTTQSKVKSILNDLDGMSDISFDTLTLTANNFTDIKMLTPEESILQSLKNLMSLPVGGNALFPERGERVGDMLFAPGLSQKEAEAYVMSYLNANEPRITVQEISSSTYINDFNEQIAPINVSYSFKNSNEIHNAIVDLKSTLA